MTRSRSIDLDELLIDMEERNQGLDVPLSPPERARASGRSPDPFTRAP
jgi:hypothetical protein